MSAPAPDERVTLGAVDAQELRMALGQSGQVRSEDDRSSLSGAYLVFRPGEGIRVQHTDGAQMTTIHLNPSESPDEPFDAVIPSTFVDEVLAGSEPGDLVWFGRTAGDDGRTLLVHLDGRTVAQPLWPAGAHRTLDEEFGRVDLGTRATVFASELVTQVTASPGAGATSLAAAPDRLFVRIGAAPAGAPLGAIVEGAPRRAEFDNDRLAFGVLTVAGSGTDPDRCILVELGANGICSLTGFDDVSGGSSVASRTYRIRAGASRFGGSPEVIEARGAAPAAAYIVPPPIDPAEQVAAILAELDAVVGQQEVKAQVRILLAQVELNKKRAAAGLRGAKAATHMVFTGPPGTGKTTIARVIARLLHALEVLPSATVIEVARPDLVAAHIGGTEEKTSAAIDAAMGGVLFIDEAYSLLAGGESDFGRQAIEVLLKALEDRRGEFVCIAAGYTTEMRDFLDANPGLRGRFTRSIVFHPYTADELVDIGIGMARANDNELDDGAVGILRLRLGDEERRGGFERDTWANARSVRNVTDAAAAHRDLRIATEGRDDRDALMTITDADVDQACNDHRIGSSVGVGESVESVLRELDRQVGQTQLKQQVRVLVAGAEAARMRVEKGLGTGAPDIPHLLFAGPPGTGKTTVARLLARLYRALGVLSQGHVVEVDPPGLVAGYVGHTAIKTTERIDEAMGGVLFIDEAYGLASTSQNSFAGEAVDTLLKRMSDDRGKLLVIAAGYPDQMDAFLNVNPGLTRRFATRIDFAPYNADELGRIADIMAEDRGERFTDEARSLLQAKLDVAERRGVFGGKNWGNAGAVGNLIEEALRLRNVRLLTDPARLPEIDELTTLTAADVEGASARILGEGPAEESVADVLAELDAQIGQPMVKRQVATLMAGVRAEQGRVAEGGGSGGALIEHVVFAGPPGTGKTTIARLLARLYKALGVLPSGHVVEVDRAGLVGGHVGQTAIKTTEKIDEAMGGILFVDEAYTLTPQYENDFGREAIDTLLARMENDRGRLAVIAAGYPDQMQTFLAANPGLPSRFTQTIDFQGYDSSALMEIAESMSRSKGDVLTEDASALLRRTLEAAESAGVFSGTDWGNARAVRNIIDAAGRARNGRIFADPASSPTGDELVALTAADIAEGCRTVRLDVVDAEREPPEPIRLSPAIETSSPAHREAPLDRARIRVEVAALVGEVARALAPGAVPGTPVPAGPELIRFGIAEVYLQGGSSMGMQLRFAAGSKREMYYFAGGSSGRLPAEFWYSSDAQRFPQERNLSGLVPYHLLGEWNSGADIATALLQALSLDVESREA